MATMRTLVLALRDKLSPIVGGPDKVIVVAQRSPQNIPHLVGDRDIVMRVRGFGVDTRTVAAAGRTNFFVRRLIDLALRTRRATDQTGSDLDWLTAADGGQLAFEDMVLDAVQLFFGDAATEIDGTVYGWIGDGEPMRIVNGGDATRDLMTADGKWGEEVITLECVYRHTFLDLERQ